MKHLSLFTIALLFLFAIPSYSQDAFDGSSDLICSSISGFVCKDDRCRKGDATEFEVPRFVAMNFSTDEIELKYRPEKKKT